MNPSTCIGWAILALLPDGPSSVPPPASPKEYEAARAEAGADAKAQVALALWCEARGLVAERARHLAQALASDPGDVTARGLMGTVAYKGQWLRPEELAESRQADQVLATKLAEYRRRRAELDEYLGPPAGRGRRVGRAEAARAHVKLGLWCEQADLKEEATAHFTSGVVLDPSRDATWKHLGYIKQNGHWRSPEQVRADRQEAEALRLAEKTWEPLLRKWRAWLLDPERRPEAERRLAEVTDPHAVTSIARVFIDGKEADLKLAVQLLGQVDTPAASRKLAELAVFSQSARVRTAATETLKHREPRDYAGMLVEMIRAPMLYQAEPVRGPGLPGGLMVVTPRYRMLRTYDAPPIAKLGGNRSGYIGYDVNGLPVAAYGAEVKRVATENPARAAADLAAIEERTANLVVDANLKAAASQERLIADVRAIEATNADAVALNDRVIPVLSETLAAPSDLRDDEDGWHKWWYDKLGYKYESPPQVTLAVNASPQYPPPVIVSCFAAGTPVRTMEGRRPIEDLVVGDRVLSQDVTTGELGFRPILVVHHNAPGATFRVKLDDGDTLIASIYHRFWLAGKGWKMARDLKAGDVLRTLGGRSVIRSVTAGPVVPVYNLDVAGSRTFFVGERDALVHDNTPPELRIRPFDAEPALASAARPAR